MQQFDNLMMEFLARCDPASPPELAEYVSRPREIQGSLEVALRPRPGSRMLLVGQNGVGKTTELKRLAKSAFADDFTIVRPPIDKDVLLDEIGWHDILCYAAEAVALQANTEGTMRAYEHLRQSMQARTEKLVTTREPSFHEKITRAMGGPVETTRIVTKGGVPEPTIAQLYRNDTTKTHRHVSEGPAQIWDLAATVFRTAEAECKTHPIVVVLDGLEKLSTDKARDLFYNNLSWIERWPSRLMVTGPFAMTAESWYPIVEDSFSNVEHVRAVSCRPGEPGASFLLDIAKRRGADLSIDEADLHDQLSWSGGLPRQYLQLLSRACQDAAVEGYYRVPHELHVRARHRLAQKWDYQLTKDDKEFLNSESFDTACAARNRLLSINAVIQYDRPDGGVSFGKNPLLGLYLRKIN